MIPVNRPLLDGNEKRYLNECIDEGWISSEGPFVRRLERNFEDYTGRKHGIAVSNGSVALDLALSALDLEPHDEVILPAFTIISCLQAVLRTGATPILVDCDPNTWNSAIEHIENAITDRTRAILIVHLYGLPCEMSPIIDLAKRHSLYIVEDAAEAHGVRYRGRPCGSFGDISTFSFYPNKLVTTGEGGIVLVDDDILAAKMRLRRNLAFGKRRFVHEDFGWNMRMSNLQAAVGCAQFERLDLFIARKLEIGMIYNELLKNTPSLSLPCPKTEYADNLYWVFGLLLNSRCSIDAQDFILKLAERGVGARPFFFPMHQQPVARRMGLFTNISLPTSEHLGRNGFYLPSGVGNTNEELEISARAVLDIVGEL